MKGEAWFYKGSRGFEDQRGYVVTLRNNTTGYNENTYIEFVYNLHNKQEYWYHLEQNPNDHLWYTHPTQQVPKQNAWGLGWWNLEDPQHPDFVSTAGPSSQSAAPQVITRTLSQPHEEFVTGTLLSGKTSRTSES